MQFDTLLKVSAVRETLHACVEDILHGGDGKDSEELTINMSKSGGGRKDVPVTAEIGVNLPLVLESTVFKDWVKAVDKDPKLFIISVHIQGVDMFGPRIGFIKFKARAQLDLGGEEGENGNGMIEVPGIVFMRGGAVGVLVILECDGVDYTILTHQARVPCGVSDLPEIPAGMLDGSGHFKGVAAEEIQEECHIVISEDELIDMTQLAYGDQWNGMIPSAGGCDEFIKLYMFRRSVEPQVIKDLEGRLTGLPDEGERIKLHLVKLHDLWKETPDAKALSALTLFSELKREGRIPQRLVDPLATAELAAPAAHVAFGGHANLGTRDELSATSHQGSGRPSSRASSDSEASSSGYHRAMSDDSSPGSAAAARFDLRSYGSDTTMSSSFDSSGKTDGSSSASKDDSTEERADQPAKHSHQDVDDTLSQMSSSSVIRGGITTRHRGRRAANNSAVGSNKPIFKKMEKEVAKWKRKHDTLEAENAELRRQVAALSASAQAESRGEAPTAA